MRTRAGAEHAIMRRRAADAAPPRPVPTPMIARILLTIVAAIALLTVVAAHGLRTGAGGPAGLAWPGALGIVVISTWHANWQPAVLNAAWAVIAVVALLRGGGAEPA